MQNTKQDLNNPKFYWAVKNDDSQLFKDTVIKYINQNLVTINRFILQKEMYYGRFIDGFNVVHKSSFSINLIANILEVEEFANLYKSYLKSKEYKDWQPEVGELVEVGNNNINFNQRIYLTRIKNSRRPFICVETGKEKSYKDELEFDVVAWKYMRRIEKSIKTEFTEEDITKAYYAGIDYRDKEERQITITESLRQFIKTL